METSFTVLGNSHEVITLTKKGYSYLNPWRTVRQLSLAKDGIVGMALGGAMGVALWEVISHHIPVLVLIQS